MKVSDFIWPLIGNLLEEDPNDIDSFFEQSMDLIGDVITEKYYNSDFGIDYSNIYLRNLFIFKVALLDKDIYNYLEYIWQIKYSESLRVDILKREISFLEKLI